MPVNVELFTKTGQTAYFQFGSGTGNVSDPYVTNLPLGAATEAKQPSLGVAGNPASNVLSIQGVPNMTPLRTDGTATIQPIIATGPDLANIYAPSYVTASFNANASLSAGITLGGRTPIYLFIASTVTTLFFSFQISDDNITWYDLFKDDGNEYQVSSALSRCIALDQRFLFSTPYIKVRAGTRDIPITQAGAFNVKLLCRYL